MGSTHVYGRMLKSVQIPTNTGKQTIVFSPCLTGNKYCIIHKSPRKQLLTVRLQQERGLVKMHLMFVS